MRPGRRLAIDVGKARVGVAVCDFHGILASGLATVARQTEIAATAALVVQTLEQQGIDADDIVEVYVGLPMNLKGLETESTKDALAVAKALNQVFGAEVRMVDERLTTVSASAALRRSGINSKKGRSVIDQVAATLILEQALSFEKASGEKPGQLITEFED
jgi:putative holliday junction resolvase